MGKAILIALIRLYQKAVSPILTPSCRFHPSCSEYAAQAIEKYGTARGLLKAAWRVLRCNPFHKGGFDPV
ncbi:MAG: membrane protein insertion efficiency factor YidD [Desulfomonilia bacterium]